MEVYSSLGGGGMGEWWRDVKNIFPNNLTSEAVYTEETALQPPGWWPVFHLKAFIISLSKVGHKLHSERWAESYSSPTDFFLESTTYITKLEISISSIFSFLQIKKLKGNRMK